ncbi:MAG: sterol desaturase family protein [Cyanobacteria bacterium P01_F01_bin.4]
MEWLAAPLGFAKYLLTAFVMYGCFMLVERIRPVERKQPWSHLWFNLRWYVIYSVVSLAIQTMGISAVVTLVQRWTGGPWIRLPVPQTGLTYVLAALFYFLVTDFFYYWFHRWQHKTAFLWEQHKLHHSEQSLNVTSTRRVHWLEDPLLVFFLAVPMGILFDFSGLALGLLTFIEVLWLQFIHMNLRLSLGGFSRVVTGPQYHRIHHSFQAEHLDKNFSAFFPLWDIVFGTYWHPQRAEFPTTGLLDGKTYNNLWVANVLPMRVWFGERYLGRFLNVAFGEKKHRKH